MELAVAYGRRRSRARCGASVRRFPGRARAEAACASASPVGTPEFGRGNISPLAGFASRYIRRRDDVCVRKTWTAEGSIFNNRRNRQCRSASTVRASAARMSCSAGNSRRSRRPVRAVHGRGAGSRPVDSVAWPSTLRDSASMRREDLPCLIIARRRLRIRCAVMAPPGPRRLVDFCSCPGCHADRGFILASSLLFI